MACLPPELVQLTIGHLKGDKPALRNASLVCSEFRHPCQKLLFSELDIAVRLSASRVATAPGPRLLALFKESHHLTFYVRKITIDFDSFCPKTCASSDPKLPLALNLIPYGGVREVRLNGVVWEVLQPATQNAIARHLRSPSLHSLSLVECSIYLVNLCSPSLQNLHLHRPTDTVSLPSQNREVSLAVPYHKSERLDSMPIRLKSLRVSIQYPKQLQITSQFLLDKVNNIDLKGLQQFYACTGLDSSAPDVVPIYESTWRLVGGCAGSLEVLGYTPCKLGPSLSVTCIRGLVPFTNLRKLAMWGYDDCQVADFVEILETISPSTPVECLHIHSFQLDTRSAEDWKRLDDVLAHLRTIRRVRIEVCCVVGKGREDGGGEGRTIEDPEIIRCELEALLPKAHREKRLELGVVPDGHLFDPYTFRWP